jgi:hypothetical protein
METSWLGGHMLQLKMEQQLQREVIAIKTVQELLLLTAAADTINLPAVAVVALAMRLQSTLPHKLLLCICVCPALASDPPCAG